MSMPGYKPKPTGMNTPIKDKRVLEFMKIGFTEYQARRLNDVPQLRVEAVRQVVNKGCNLDIAYRIFRP